MFCENCGTQLQDGVTKCGNCGHDMAAANEPAVEKMQAPKMPNVKMPAMNTNSAAAMNNNKMIGIIACVVVLVVLVGFLLTRKTTVDLNDYLTVEFSGYDTVGRASVTFDREKFTKDFEDKLELDEKAVKKSKGRELLELYSYFSGEEYCDLFLEGCVSGKLDKTNKLTNGDKVVYEWDCNDDDALEYFNVKLKYKDKEFKVEGLEKADTVNPFESIEVIFSGISPQGSATVEKTGSDDITRSIYFEVTPSNGLENGDVVKVKVNSAGNDDYYIEQYGAILSETEKEYTVEGLDSYAQSASEISTDMLEKMKKQAEDHFHSQTVSWEDEVSVTGITYLGNYFLSPKFSDRSNSNFLYLVYKVDTLFTNDKHSERLSFYYYTRFDNIMTLSDGTTSVDLSRYTAPSSWDGFNHEFRWGDGWGDYERLVFPGYQDIDTMFNKLVTANISDYEYENNVTE